MEPVTDDLAGENHRVLAEREVLVPDGMRRTPATVSSLCSSKAAAESYVRPMTCRVEVFVRSGHTIDLALEDGEDRVFANGLHEAWVSPPSPSAGDSVD